MTSEVTFYPSEARVMPLALMQCERRLPAQGEVLVHQGARVEPTDVVARVHQTQDFRILDVARKLHVARAQASRFMRKKVGEAVETDEVLAERGGFFFGREVRAPAKGVIAALGNGRVLLEVAPELIELRAYLKGTVAAVMPGMGVMIEAAGAIAQGTWGCGGEAFGVLRVVADKPDEPLRAKNIDVACHGAIVVGGGTIDTSAFEQAQQLQVRGLIAGSMDGELRERAEAAPFPVILTEGFGRAPMAEPIFQLLHGQTGREASISAETRARFGATRPEILIPLPTESRPAPPPPAGAPLKVGARVRIVRPPYLGAVGTVSAIVPRVQRVESGARLRGVEVNLGGDTGTVFVPYVNLELLR
jgi:multidrug efflux pump subunit AcrA (membrane-fusion protein)